MPARETRLGRASPVVKALLAAVALYTVLHVGYSALRYSPFASPRASADFHRAFLEAHEARTTGTLNLDNVLHPPLYYVVLRPLTYMEFPTVVQVLYCSQFLWYLLAIVWIVKAAGPASKPPWAAYGLAAALILNFQPFLETMASHKVEGIEFALICLAIALYRTRRDLLAGVVIVFAANLKYLPGILGLYFLLKRERRVIAGMLLGAALVALILVAAYGPRQFWGLCLRYPMVLMFGHGHEGNVGGASIEFQTLSGTVNRWLVGLEGMRLHFRTQAYVMVPQIRLAFSLAAALKWLAVAAYAWTVWPRRDHREREARWGETLCELALTLVLAFVIAQASRVHYGILTLPGFVAVGLLLAQQPARFRWWEWAAWGAAYALTAMLIPGGLLNRLPPSPVWGPYHSFAYLWFSLPFYGYLLLGVAAILCRRRLRLP